VSQRRKEEINLHKANSSKLTKQQQLASILKGKSPCISSCGQQTQKMTNPNANDLDVVSNSLVVPYQTSTINKTPLAMMRRRYKYSQHG
jgi:hypothetical protein